MVMDWEWWCLHCNTFTALFIVIFFALIQLKKKKENSTASTSSRVNAFYGVIPVASQSPSILTKRKSYDVFINHRGPDVKHNLASVIYNTLDLLGLRAFLDAPELTLGDPIPAEIEEAMCTAPLHIAIFSVNYAESPWCLAELTFMLKAEKTIIPVFYNVAPDHLRWVAQGKGIYASAFSKYADNGRYTSNILDEWKWALEKVSNLSGYILNSEIDDEGKLLKDIMEKVRIELNKVPLKVAKHPVTTQQHHKGSITSEVCRPNYVPMVLTGGRGGSSWDDGIYSGIRKIVVRFGTVIDSIKVQYDLNGRSIWSKHHGGTGGAQAAEVEFDYPNEVLVSINGQYYIFNNLIVVTSLSFHTNHKKYGPFGDTGGHHFVTPSVGCKILGFYGRSGQFLDAIGAHLVMEDLSGQSIEGV